ncbi:MFS general substrate transporter [Meredithblackwellia eburnea MCA 4105]
MSPLPRTCDPGQVTEYCTRAHTCLPLETCDTLSESTQDVEKIEKEGTSEPLPPLGGRKAWTVVLGCFLLSAAFQGFGFTWAVFMEYYHTHELAHVSLAALNMSGGLFNFAMNASSFVFGRLGDRFGFKKMIAVGGIAAFIFQIVSAFGHRSFTIVLHFQGLFVGVAHGAALPLFMSLPSTWFDPKRRGLATGIALSGSGVGGAVFSTIARALIVKLGPRDTLLIYAGAQAAVVITGWLLIAQRKLGAVTRASQPWLPKGIWRDKAWWSLTLCVAVSIFGYLAPYFFIVTYTRQVCTQFDPNSNLMVVPLVVMTIAGSFGRVAAGLVADQFGPLNTMWLSFFIGGASQALIWTFSNSFGSIIAFSVVYGMSGTVYMSLLSVAAASLFDDEQGLATLTGYLATMNAPGQLLGGTLFSAAYTGSGNNWTVVSTVSGSIMLAGSMILLVARFSRQPKLFGFV